MYSYRGGDLILFPGVSSFILKIRFLLFVRIYVPSPCLPLLLFPFAFHLCLVLPLLLGFIVSLFGLTSGFWTLDSFLDIVFLWDGLWI